MMTIGPIGPDRIERIFYLVSASACAVLFALIGALTLIKLAFHGHPIERAKAISGGILWPWSSAWILCGPGLLQRAIGRKRAQGLPDQEHSFSGLYIADHRTIIGVHV